MSAHGTFPRGRISCSTKGKKPKPKGEEGEDHAASEEYGELGECSA